MEAAGKRVGRSHKLCKAQQGDFFKDKKWPQDADLEVYLAFVSTKYLN